MRYACLWNRNNAIVSKDGGQGLVIVHAKKKERKKQGVIIPRKRDACIKRYFRKKETLHPPQSGSPAYGMNRAPYWTNLDSLISGPTPSPLLVHHFKQISVELQ